MTRTPEQRAALQQVIDWLAAGAPHTKINEQVTLSGFNFGDWVTIDYAWSDTQNSCGSLCCISGAVVQFRYPDLLLFEEDEEHTFEDRKPPDLDYAELGQGILGLCATEKALMFYPFSMNVSDLLESGYIGHIPQEYSSTPLEWVEHLSPQNVAKVLQKFQDTEVLDWGSEEDYDAS